MIKVQLTEKAENIVNQIMSADAVDVSYGPVKVRVYTDNINFDDEGVIMNTSENDDAGVPFISNDSINKAEIEEGNIVIPLESNHFWTVTISLLKLNKIVAIN
jgi:hypothetical protein